MLIIFVSHIMVIGNSLILATDVSYYVDMEKLCEKGPKVKQNNK